MKFKVTFKVAWDNDHEFIDFEFDSKDLESLHKNIKTAIDENYLEPELEINKQIVGDVSIDYVLIIDSDGNEVFKI